MSRQRGERVAARHHLVNHELSIVLAECAVRIARIGTIRTTGPLPDRAEGVVARRAPIPTWSADACRPSARTRPPHSNVRDRRVRIDGSKAAERQRMPSAVAVVLAPIAGRGAAFRLDGTPAIGEPLLEIAFGGRQWRRAITARLNRCALPTHGASCRPSLHRPAAPG
jgi:hypothetical protein